MRALALLLAACTATDDPVAPPEHAGESPDPGDAGERAELLDPGTIGVVDLRLSEAASAALASDEGTDTWVESTVAVDLGGEPIVLDRVGLQVKGSSTFVAWPGKSSLKMKLDAFVEGQDVDGIERVAMHNMVEDPSYLREAMAWWAFRELDAFGARAAHVAVLDNGVAHGEPNNLYLMVEALNGDFLGEWFDDTRGPLWEVAAGGLDGAGLWCDRGDCTDTSTFDALAAAIANATDDELVEQVSVYLDWDAFLRFWALEVMVEQNDGFVGAGHNFRVYWEPTREKFYLIPWSLDQTFGDEGTLMVPMGVNTLVTRCYGIEACRADFDEALLDVADEWEDAGALAEIDRMQALLVAEGFADEASTTQYEFVRTIVEERPALARRFVEND